MTDYAAQDFAMHAGHDSESAMMQKEISQQKTSARKREEARIAEMVVALYCVYEPDKMLALAAEIGMCANWFHHAGFAAVFACAQQLHEAGEAVDIVSVGQEIGRWQDGSHAAPDGLAQWPHLDIAWLNDALDAAQDSVPVFAPKTMRQLIAHVGLGWRLRQTHAVLDALRPKAAAARNADELDAIADEAIAQIEALRIDEGKRSLQDWVQMREGMHSHLQLLEERAQGFHGAWPTGLGNLDAAINGGLRPGALYVVGARPGQGKSALVLSAAMHMAKERPTGFFSLEMGRSEIYDRMTAAMCDVPMHALLNPQQHELDWERVAAGVEEAAHLKLCLCDRGGLNINEVRQMARKLHQTRGLQVLVLDYVGLLAPSSASLKRKDCRAQQIEEATRGLKALAKELGIAVLALAQLNRNVEGRTSRRPQLSDLRDSGSIEQDADVVMGLHRAALDNPDLQESHAAYAELMVLKNRQGPTGRVHLHYTASRVLFSDWIGDPPDEGEASPQNRARMRWKKPAHFAGLN